MVNQDKVELIKDLLNSQGWVIYQNLLVQWLQDRQKEQAVYLRQCNPEDKDKPIYVQGKIDGATYIGSNLLTDYLKQENPQDEEKPRY